MVWIVLLLGWSWSWIPLDKLKDWIPVVGILALALAYTLGVVFDRFLGLCTSILQILFNCFKWNWFMHLKLRLKQLFYKSLDEYSLTLLEPSEAIRHLEKFERQTRLMRATFANAFLIAFIGHFKYGLPRFLFLLLLLVGFIAFLNWCKAHSDYNVAIKNLFNKKKHKPIVNQEIIKKGLFYFLIGTYSITPLITFEQ